MKIAKIVIPAVVAGIMAGGAYANTITQQFASSWTISTWDYYGDVAALQWHYVPYTPWDASLGELKAVTITTAVNGVKDESDSVQFRYAFFTGWAPNQYQFYDSGYFASGTESFSQTRTFTSEVNLALSNFENYQYLPQANYYFESRSARTHTVDALTELTYEYVPASIVPEPVTGYLLFTGLAALAITRRRRSVGRT